jgi:hypothetical protein
MDGHPQPPARHERAIARGEVRADLDLEVAFDGTYGPLYRRLVRGHTPLTARFAQDVVDLARGGIANPPPPTGGSGTGVCGFWSSQIAPRDAFRGSGDVFAQGMSDSVRVT